MQFASEVTPEVVRDISKSDSESQDYMHKLYAFMENILGSEMCLKFESEEISITVDYCNKSDSKQEDRG